MVYKKTSEWVSPAHPDRMADIISATIINNIYKENGWNAHAAIEVAIFNNKIIIGGEYSAEKINFEELKELIRNAIRKIGYTEEYHNKFNKDEVYTVEDYEIIFELNPQSSDIAHGTTNKELEEKGWNDQGTYVGFASSFTGDRLSLEHSLATKLGNLLYQKAKESSNLGIDIKTLISCDYDDDIKISNITIACPTVSDKDKEAIDEIKDVLSEFKGYVLKTYNNISFNGNLIINGTGVYHKHGSLADSGLTGRKLVVNQCGNYAAGGSMIKPILASDRLLNLYARHIAKVAVDCGLGENVTVELSATIGQKQIGTLNIIGSTHTDALYEYFSKKLISPYSLNKEWKTLERNNFDEVVFNNFFGSCDYVLEPWEDTAEDVSKLLDMITKKY